ncbi:MAG: exopolysaccharide biosynthesis protein [Bdellovibrionota bacterium]
MRDDAELIREERFSTILTRIKAASETGDITLRELVALFGPRGHAFLTLFLVLPFMQPIPIPGVSTLLGLMMAMAGFFMMRGRPPWVPERFAHVRIEKHFLLRVGKALESLLVRLERVVRPRGIHMFSRPWFRMANGFLLLSHGLLLSLPLPIPFSNFLPAMVLFLIALGSLEEDVVVIAAGYTATVANAIFFALIALAPMYAAHRLA